tara:strand:+ start:283 stop:459 length:177 start_codon:yes stop_codon:yes gene_type:complete
MTYEQTKKLMSAITDIETFSIARTRLVQQETWDGNKVYEYDKYVEEAKKTIFDMMNSD